MIAQTFCFCQRFRFNHDVHLSFKWMDPQCSLFFRPENCRWQWFEKCSWHVVKIPQILEFKVKLKNEKESMMLWSLGSIKHWQDENKKRAHTQKHILLDRLKFSFYWVLSSIHFHVQRHPRHGQELARSHSDRKLDVWSQHVIVTATWERAALLQWL